MKAPRFPFFYGWAIVAVVFVTIGIGVNARTAFSLLFPPILDEFGWDRGVTAGAFSFGFFISAFLSPLLGRLMDKHGPLIMLEAGVAVMGAGLLLAAQVTQPWQLYLTIGVLVVLILLAPLNLLVRRRPEDLGLEPDGDRTAAATTTSAGHENVVDRAWVAIDWTLARALRTARFWWIALGFFCALFSWYAIQVHQTKYLTESGFSPMYAAWALGFVSFVAIPGQIALGHISDRIGREWVWAVGNAGFVLCYAALLLMRDYPQPALLWFMVLVQGFLGYGVTSVLGAIVAEIFQGRQFGSIFGSLMGIGLIGGAVGPWVTGALHDASGSYMLAFSIAIGASVISALCIWRAAPRQIRAVAGRIGQQRFSEPGALR